MEFSLPFFFPRFFLRRAGPETSFHNFVKIIDFFLRRDCPFFVRQYFCLQLLGLSGIVSEIRSYPIAGFRYVALECSSFLRLRIFWSSCLVNITGKSVEQSFNLTGDIRGTSRVPPLGWPCGMRSNGAILASDCPFFKGR